MNLARGVCLVALLLLVLVGCGQAATRHAGRARTWWYHGYPPHDEIRLRGEVGPVAVGLGKVWAVATNPRTDRPRLVRIDPRREAPNGHVPLDSFDPALAVGAGHVWTFSGARCRTGSGSCRVLVGLSPHSLRAGPRAVLRGPEWAYPRLLVADDAGVWAANQGDLAAATPGPGLLWRIDASGHVVARISLPLAPLALAASDDRVWIADSHGDLRALDTRTNRLLRLRKKLSAFPPAAIAAAGDSVWAAGPEGLVEVDGRSFNVVRRVHFSSPATAEVAATGRWVWVTTAGGNVYRIDAVTGRPGRPFPLKDHHGLEPAPGLLWTAREHAVVRMANWPGWDPRPRAPGCRASQLRASASFQGATGSLAGGIYFTNTSHATCTLAGYPRLRLADARGRPLPIAVSHARPQWAFSTAPGNWPYQTVKPRRSSGFEVWWSNWCGRPARVVFHVRLGGGLVQASHEAGPRCDGPGNPSTMTISPYGGGFGL